MTDDWTPDNLPILLMDRSLLTATRAKPIRIGRARVTQQDEEALLAMDAAFEDRDEDTLQSRYEASADWLGELAGLPYQVSYYFPSTVRPNSAGKGRYGAGNMTYRVLYESLCNAFNGGRRFIEDYFFSVFEEHMKAKYERAVMDLKQRIADEAQARRKAHRAYLSNYNEWTSPMTKDVFNRLAIETKKDIVNSLATGKIPLNKNGLSDKTMAARKRLGITSDKVFYATGRLISSIVVSVVLLDEQTAAMEGQQ